MDSTTTAADAAAAVAPAVAPLRKNMITPTPQPPFIEEPVAAAEEEEEIVTFRIKGQHVPAAVAATSSGECLFVVHRSMAA